MVTEPHDSYEPRSQKLDPQTRMSGSALAYEDVLEQQVVDAGA